MGIHLGCIALAMAAGAAAGADRWHPNLYLGRGGLWRQRVRIDVRNEMDGNAAGEPVSVTIGTKAGQAALVGAAAEAVRVCDAAGVEVLYALTGPDGQAVHRGAIPAGGVLTIPAECAAKATTAYWVYFDNPAAWGVPDFLPAAAGVRNGSAEAGAGDAPAGWRHDVPDAAHAASWSSENPHSGKRCLKTVVAAGAEPTWIATRQSGIAVRGGATYVVSAWVKAAGVRGSAGWYVHVGTPGEPMMISPMLLGGGGTYGWKKVTARFTAPEGASVASLGTVLRGTGTAWFDDVTMACLTPSLVSAVAGQVERLRTAALGADAPWQSVPGGGERPNRRVAVTACNLSDRPRAGALIAVEAATVAAALGRGTEAAGMLVSDGRAVLPSCTLGPLFVFRGGVPARTVRTFHVYPGGEAAPEAAIARYGQMLGGPGNLVRNASFETGAKLPDGWPGGAEGSRPAGTEMALDAAGRFGGRCARLHVPHDARPAWTGWRQDVAVRPGGTYLFAAWVKCKDVRNGSVQLHAHYLDAAGKHCRRKQFAGVGPAITGTRDWTLLAGTFTMPDDAAVFQLHLTMNATGTVWHDGVLLAEILPGAPGRAESRRAAGTDGVAAWSVNAVVKVFQEDGPPAKRSPVRISAARNEKEALQIAFRSPRAIGQVTVEIDPPSRPGGARLPDPSVGVVGYVPIDHPTSYYRSDSPAWHRKFPTSPGRCDGWAGMWPDPILPKRTFELAAGRTQPVWITVSVPAGAAAGDYLGAVRLMRGGRCLAKVPFTVHVWDFALPPRTSFAAIYDVRMRGALWRRPGEGIDAARRRMWRFMAERRLCPDRVQPEPSLRYVDGEVRADFAAYDKAAAYYFDVLKLPHAYAPRSFYLFGWGHPPKTCFGERPYEGDPPYESADRGKLRPAFRRAYQACLRAYWRHVKAKGWHRKMTLYISDEPHDRHAEIRRQMEALCAMIHEVDAEIPIYSSTWHHQPEWDGSLDVWGIGHYGIVPPEKMAQLREAGKRIWFTTDGQMCTDTPYCAVERLLPHYAFHYGVEAYEFWGIDWLTYDPYAFGWHRYIHQSDRPGSSYYVRYPNGDGYLAYPGAPVGHGGIVSSVRLEQAREGVEDYEYLRLLRQAGARAPAGPARPGAAAALARARKLVAIPNAGGRYSTRILPDPDAVLRVREAVARAIERR